MFHTHTVAGIVISFALFVIFYAGAFSLFRYEIKQWEDPAIRRSHKSMHDLERGLAKLDAEYHINWEKDFSIYPPTPHNNSIGLWAKPISEDSIVENIYVSINAQDEIKDLDEPKTTLSNTIYDLHFFNQIPTIGQFLAGVVSMFFLFAIVSGVLIHSLPYTF